MNELVPRAVAWGRDLTWMCINLLPAPHLVCRLFNTVSVGGQVCAFACSPGLAPGCCEASTSLLKAKLRSRCIGWVSPSCPWGSEWGVFWASGT